MFGLVRRAQLKKLSRELKESSLQEVIEKYAKNIQPTIIAYDESIAMLYAENISVEDKENSELLISKLHTIKNTFNLAEGSEKIYLAYATFNSLSTCALELTMATKFMSSTTDAVDYLLENWITKVPIHFVLAVLFPAKCADRTEDFDIDVALRHAMIDEFIKRMDGMTNILTVEDFLSNFANDFAAENPYYKVYPL